MKKIKILLIEDNEDDGFFFKKALSKSSIQSEVVYTPDGVSGLEALKNITFDCIFLDYHLPMISGLEVLKKIRDCGIDIPVIMLTGQKDQETTVKLMKEGAYDYISKDALTPEALRLSIENSNRLYKIKKEKRRAEEAVIISQVRLAEAQKIAQLGNWEYDFNERKNFFSEEAYKILEYDQRKCKPSFLSFIRKVYPGDFFILKDCVDRLKQDPHYDITFRICASDNSIKYINAKGRVVSDDTTRKIIGTIQDVTILKNAVNDTKKATIKSKATTIVFSIAIILFLLSEAVLDPFIDSMTASIIIALSFKGSIALMLKPVEVFLEKIMLSKII